MEETLTRLEAGCCLGGPPNSVVSQKSEPEKTALQRCFSSFLLALIGAHCLLTLITGAFLITRVTVMGIEIDRFNNRTVTGDELAKDPNPQLITCGVLLLANCATTLSLIFVFCVNQLRFTKAALAWCFFLCIGSLAAFVTLRETLDVYTTDTLLLSTALLALIESISMFIHAFYQKCCEPDPQEVTARSVPSLPGPGHTAPIKPRQ